jgi:hypothetical protein
VRLTTSDTEYQGRPVATPHPDHFNALHQADLWYVTRDDPTLRELLTTNKTLEDPARLKKKKKDQERNVNVYFCVGFSMFWKKPLHMIITSLKRKPGLSWLRFSMYYHRFPNLREIFQSHLTAKMIENVESIEFLTCPCNCRDPPDPPVPLGTTKPKWTKKKKRGTNYPVLTTIYGVPL